MHRTPESTSLAERLTRGFTHWAREGYDPEQLHELEGVMPSVRETPEKWSRDILFKFLAAKRTFPPCNNVSCQECYHPVTGDPFPIQTKLDNDNNNDEESEVEVNKLPKDGHLKDKDGD